ncbi:MAG: hypothetical protein ACFFAX_03090 [Promethearchaeota archaeon]
MNSKHLPNGSQIDLLHAYYQFPIKSILNEASEVLDLVKKDMKHEVTNRIEGIELVSSLKHLLEKLSADEDLQNSQEFHKALTREISTELDESFFEDDEDNHEIRRRMSRMELLASFGEFAGLRDSSMVQEALLGFLNARTDELFNILNSDWVKNGEFRQKLSSILPMTRTAMGDDRFSDHLNELQPAALDEFVAGEIAKIVEETNHRRMIMNVFRGDHFAEYESIQNAVAAVTEKSDLSEGFPFYITRVYGSPPKMADSPAIKDAIARAVENAEHAPIAILDLLGAPSLLQDDSINSAVVGLIRRTKVPWEYVGGEIQGGQFFENLESYSQIEEAMLERIPDMVQAIRNSERPFDVVQDISEKQVLITDERIQAALAERPQILKAQFMEYLRQLMKRGPSGNYIRRTNPRPGWILKYVKEGWALDAFSEVLEDEIENRNLVNSILHVPEILSEQRTGFMAHKLLRSLMRHNETLHRQNTFPRIADPVLVASFACLLKNPVFAKNQEDTVANLLLEFPLAIKDVRDVPSLRKTKPITKAMAEFLWKSVQMLLSGHRNAHVFEEVLNTVRLTKWLSREKEIKVVVKELKKLYDKNDVLRRFYRLGNILRMF